MELKPNPERKVDGDITDIEPSEYLTKNSKSEAYSINLAEYLYVALSSLEAGTQASISSLIYSQNIEQAITKIRSNLDDNNYDSAKVERIVRETASNPSIIEHYRNFYEK